MSWFIDKKFEEELETQASMGPLRHLMWTTETSMVFW